MPTGFPPCHCRPHCPALWSHYHCHSHCWFPWWPHLELHNDYDATKRMVWLTYAPTHHHGCLFIPEVVTHSAKCIIVADFYSSFSSSWRNRTIHEPHLPIIATCDKDTKIMQGIQKNAKSKGFNPLDKYYLHFQNECLTALQHPCNMKELIFI